MGDRHLCPYGPVGNSGTVDASRVSWALGLLFAFRPPKLCLSSADSAITLFRTFRKALGSASSRVCVRNAGGGSRGAEGHFPEGKQRKRSDLATQERGGPRAPTKIREWRFVLRVE